MLKVLVVEDETTTRKGILRVIPWGDLGFGAVEEACDGSDALEKAAWFQPNLLVTDVRMPGMTGIELVKALREKGFPFEVVFLSGYADKEYLKAAIRLGAVRYVEKPVDPDELIEAIRAAAKKSGRAQPVESDCDNSYCVSRIIQLIDERYSEANLSIKSLADSVFLSPTYLSTLFKKETGVTIYQKITQCRMEHAKRQLLWHNEKKLAEVAYGVGYRDANRFSKAFKKYTGMVPSQFRQAHVAQ